MYTWTPCWLLTSNTDSWITSLVPRPHPVCILLPVFVQGLVLGQGPRLLRIVAHVCYKANSNVCHTAVILDAAHGNAFNSQLTTLSLYSHSYITSS